MPSPGSPTAAAPVRSTRMDPAPDAADEASRATPETPAATATRHRRIALRRPVVVAAVTVGLLSLGLMAVAVLRVSNRDVSEVLLPPVPVDGADLRADVTVISVDPQVGEARLRLVPVVLDPDRAEGGLVTSGFRILVNDAQGEGTHTFAPGQPVQAIEFSVALNGSSVYRYPFDRYEASLVVLAADGTGTGGDPLLTELSVTSSVIAFDVAAARVPQDACPFGTCATLDAARPATTVGYTIWFMVLAWGLALAGLAVLYQITRHGVELPLWVFGYLVGVLFALPPLRASLPGSPPPGGVVDFVAFYWAVAVVGLTLLGLAWLWVREARPRGRSPG